MAALAALVFIALAGRLPAETFFAGDPGVKLIAARHARASPSAPFAIPLPSIGGEPVPAVEPLFLVHGDHSHAVTSELFPIASAPFIALFGIRGAYVLPALGFCLALAGCAAIGRTLDRDRRTVTVMLAAALGTPLLFYGLEFWEHAPAAGATAIATALWLRDRPFAAGALFGIAILLRPEAICYVIAVGIASPLLPDRPRGQALVRAGAGLLVALAPMEVYALVHFHSLLPAHVSSNSASIPGNWFATRTELAARWFIPQALAIPDWWGVALILTAVTGPVVRSGRGGRTALAAIVLIGAALVLLVAPNDGGSQWGPRYLLLAFVPAAILLADAVDAASRRRSIGLLIIVVLVAAGGWAQRDGYRRLRTTKIVHGRVLELVRSQAPPGTTVVTDLWWLDQVAAAATDSRQVLFAADAQSASRIMALLDRAAIPEVTVVRSRSESPDVDSWVGQTCYRETGTAEIPERRLIAFRLMRACR